MTWEAYDNDNGVPDCTVVAAANAVGLWTLEFPTQDQVTKAYKDYCGANPCDPETLLFRWLAEGIAGHHIHAFAKLSSQAEARTAIEKFGCAFLSVNGQFLGIDAAAGKHTILAIAYDDQGLTAVSYGQEVPITWNHYDQVIDQAYAISEDFDPWVIAMALKNDWRLWVLLGVLFGTAFIISQML